MSDPNRVSVVIPVLNDGPALGVLLGHLAAMPEPPDECIVVDGGDDPQCRELCERHRCHRVPARPGRGHQLHTGALRSSGDIVWFMHADAQPVHDSIVLIRRHIAAGFTGGYFRFSFTGPDTWQKRLLARLINWRSRVGIPYGDQGLFLEREAYMRTSGFTDVPLFEEVRLVRAARSAGRFSPLKAVIGVSPRRWERDGWLRRTLGNRLLACGHMIGISPTRLARRYAAQPDKESARC